MQVSLLSTAYDQAVKDIEPHKSAKLNGDNEAKDAKALLEDAKKKYDQGLKDLEARLKAAEKAEVAARELIEAKFKDEVEKVKKLEELKGAVELKAKQDLLVKERTIGELRKDVEEINLKLSMMDPAQQQHPLFKPGEEVADFKPG